MSFGKVRTAERQIWGNELCMCQLKTVSTGADVQPTAQLTINGGSPEGSAEISQEQGRGSADDSSMETYEPYQLWGETVHWCKDTVKLYLEKTVWVWIMFFPQRYLGAVLLTSQRGRSLPVHSRSLWWGMPHPSSVCLASPLLWPGESSQRTTWSR